MIRSYDELVGGVGRAVAYRAERHLVRDLLATQAAQLLIEQEEYPLHDVAMNGVSFRAPINGTEWRIGATLPVTLLIHGKPIYQGLTRIARTEQTSNQLHIGLQVLKGFIDLPKIRERDEEQALASNLYRSPDEIREQVPKDYREMIERAVHLIQYYRHSLKHHEARYLEMGEAGKAPLQAMALRALDAIRPIWNSIQHDAAKTLLQYFGQSKKQRAIKRYTETMLTNLLLDSPIVHRAYNKPLGYAGDFKTMLYLYQNQLDGPNILAKIFHKLHCEEPLAAGVRTRKDMVVNFTQNEQRLFFKTRGQSDHFRITSLASGLAQEVIEFIERNRWEGNIHWTLIDQEEKALSLAYHDIYQALAMSSAQGDVRCMYMSFMQLLKDTSSVLAEDPQNLIYSVGLFDYLREKSAQCLVKKLYEHLAPGGLLLIANALWPNEHFWAIEFINDWTLIFRTKEEMYKLVSNLPGNPEFEVFPEPSNAYYFLLIRKP